MIQNPAECFEANLPFTNVLVPINARTKVRLRIVDVNDTNAVDADRAVNRLQRLFQTVSRANIPSGRKGVRSINANAERQVRSCIKNRPQFFKARTHGRTLSRGILEKNL